MSMMVSFVLSFFPRDVLDEILNLIESVSEDFPSYSLLTHAHGLMRRRLLPDVCSYCVSRNASASLARRGLTFLSLVFLQPFGA